jgi:hypothetical protein
MGLFSNSSTSRFKDIFIETNNLISSFSYGTLQMSDSVAKLKIEANFEELKEMARGFNNPFDEYFSVYFTSIYREKLSIGQALYIIYEFKNQSFLFDVKISNRVTEEIIYKARSISRTREGQIMMFNTIFD